MIRATKYRILRNRHEENLHGMVDATASIWNYYVALTRRYYRRYGKGIPKNVAQKHVLKRRRKNPYWSQIGAQSAQEAIERLYKAYDRFFKSYKNKTFDFGRPRFKKRKNFKSFVCKQNGFKFNFETNLVRIQDWVFRFANSQEITGTIKRVSVKRDSVGNFWLCVVYDDPNFHLPCLKLAGRNDRNYKGTGMDFGLKHFLTLPSGQRIDHPLPFKNSMIELKRLQRSLARKIKDSRRYNQVKIMIARLHRRIADIREWFFYDTAHRLCRENDFIAIEDLNIRGMKKLWGRKVSDLAWGKFVSVLEWVGKKTGTAIVKISRWFPSTKTCSCCGHINHDITLKDREWNCPECGTYHERDINAATMIQREGVRVGTLTWNEIVRPDSGTSVTEFGCLA